MKIRDKACRIRPDRVFFLSATRNEAPDTGGLMLFFSSDVVHLPIPIKIIEAGLCTFNLLFLTYH